ncbi:MAG: 4-hydroxythreonine-4-phosphate dehydrogenase PdxA [Chitinophagales bacterium]|nr:4-hydroxythreonine-4-phosphate dehydrogenase PdxA [Chitinophagales bacterium]
MEHKPVVGITIGDYNGIGPEVIMKALSDERLFHFADFVIYGSRPVMSYHAKLLKIQNFQMNEITSFEKLSNKLPNVFNCWSEQAQIKVGEATNESGARAMVALNTAIEDLKANKIQVLVTGPVNKQSIAVHHPDFRGQTEYITTQCDIGQSMMMLCDDNLRVGLVTNHLSLKDVAAAIDINTIVSKIELLNHSLKQDFLVHKPRIAVLGLNPHAGDNSLLGKEEKEIIAPAVNRAKDKGILALGPFAADGFFGSHHYRHFDAVLAMYHDQGLVPFKTLTFDTGVNYTAGLPVVRTSPDHGTAYDIAGKDSASAGSLRNAIFMGLEIVKCRANYAEITANPVEKVTIDKE